ncbi:hypothetical protein BJY00DRAFT_94374 [Aspergillus carlsbadensis]|nr:hypothetical protein BJY00DRAFT_94374 [Aspergillus carlsbadensis]
MPVALALARGFVFLGRVEQGRGLLERVLAALPVDRWGGFVRSVPLSIPVPWPSPGGEDEGEGEGEGVGEGVDGNMDEDGDQGQRQPQDANAISALTRAQPPSAAQPSTQSANTSYGYTEKLATPQHPSTHCAARSKS